MEIVNITKNTDKTFKLFFKYFFYKFFLKIYLSCAVIAIAWFTYVFLNIPEELNKVKTIFLLTVGPSLTFSLFIIPFILKRGIKNRLYKNESIFEYRFNNNSLEFNKTENKVKYFCKIDYSLIIVVIETKELFILNTSYNSYPTLIIDKNEFIEGTCTVLRELLKNKIKKYKQTFKSEKV